MKWKEIALTIVSFVFLIIHSFVFIYTKGFGGKLEREYACTVLYCTVD